MFSSKGFSIWQKLDEENDNETDDLLSSHLSSGGTPHSSATPDLLRSSLDKTFTIPYLKGARQSSESGSPCSSGYSSSSMTSQCHLPARIPFSIYKDSPNNSFNSLPSQTDMTFDDLFNYEQAFKDWPPWNGFERFLPSEPSSRNCFISPMTLICLTVQLLTEFTQYRDDKQSEYDDIRRDFQMNGQTVDINYDFKPSVSSTPCRKPQQLVYRYAARNSPPSHDEFEMPPNTRRKKFKPHKKSLNDVSFRCGVI
jgi:hypothetical protein